MSAEMLLAMITTRHADPAVIDWAAAKTALTKVNWTGAFIIDDYEGLAIRHLGHDDIYTPDGELKLESLRELGVAILEALARALGTSEVDLVTLGGRTAFVSGGLSHGDAPTEAATAIWDAYCLPANVLQAAGLGNNLPDSPPVVLEQPRTDADPIKVIEALQATQINPDRDMDTTLELIEKIINTVRDSYSLALRDPELDLSPETISRVDTTVSDAVANHWF